MRTTTRWKIAYAGLAVLDTTLAGSPRPRAHRLRFLTKPLLMPTLTASLATSPRSSGLRSSTLVAQGFSWGGDVALLAHGTPAFGVGAGSFGVAHLAYLTGFRRRGDRSRPLRGRPPTRALLGLWAVSSPLLARGSARKDPVLALAVVSYGGILTTMAAHALQLDDTVPVPARRLISGGALLFLVSDTILGLRTFVLTDPPPTLETAVMATYTLAQLLLSEGAGRAG